MPSDSEKRLYSPSASGPGADFTNFLSRMQFPAMPDMEAVLSAHRKNMEALTQANRVAMEGAQAIAKRNMEIMQQTMAELSQTVQAMTSAEAPQAKAAKQTDLVKATYERAVANMQEIGDLIQRSNSEALGLINSRFAEGMEELKALVAKSSR